MEICVNGSPLSETQLPYHSDSDEHIVIENIRTENSFVQAISIHSFRCETTVCEIVTFAHSFHKDFLSTVSKTSKESDRSFSMYGALNPTGNTQFQQGSVKYYSPTELSKICRQNPDSPSNRESDSFLLSKNCENNEQEKMRRHYQDRDADEKSRKKMNREKKRNKKEGKEGTSYGPYYMMANQEDEEKREKKHKRDKKKEFSELNYYDLQCLINDCNRDQNIPPNVKKDRNAEVKKHQRSQSIDQIPTKDVTSDQKLLRRHERPRSAERREDQQAEKNKEYFMKYYAQNPPTNVQPPYDPRGQHFMAPNQQFQFPIQHSSKKHKEKSKLRKKAMRESEMPEFVTLDQINEQTMNIKDSKFENHKYNRWEVEKNVRHHQQREFYGEYNQQQYRNNPEMQNNDHEFNTYAHNPDEYNKILQNYYQQPMVNEVDTKRSKRKEKKKEKIKDQKKKESDKEYKALKKYMKKLAKEQQKETFYFTTKDNVGATPPVHERRQNRDKKYLEENLLQLEPEFNQNATGYIENSRTYKHARKEFIPLDLGLDEMEIPPKHRKMHDHKKTKNKRETAKKESVEKMRSNSLSVKDKQKNLNDIIFRNDELDDIEHGLKKYKSETSLASTTNDKNIVCIYQSKDSPEEKDDTNTVKLTKKQECLSLETDRKFNKKPTPEIVNKEKERSPYNRNHMVLPTEHKKQLSDVLNTQERTLLFQKAMKRDFPSRPRPRLSRSRQRSSKYLAKLEDAKYNNSTIKIDEKPTKEVHCYDVGTSTILDNNFGEILELLKGEPSMKPPCTNKKRSVFHVKKKASREDLVETSRKACDNSEQTLGIVVKGIEPPKKIEPPKVRSRFKFTAEKPKINRLECKILSVVAIAPTKFDDDQKELDPNPIKTQSTPHMQHETITEKRIPSSDKRLERLLKYYKVEAQSKISDPSKSSQKSMKELIANKLSDYLRKLQEDDNDEMLQIQTDDPKVVKLVLPIEFTGLECSKSSVTQNENLEQVDEKPKESFSDLYINYSAENNGEDEECFNEIPNGGFKLLENTNAYSENFNSTQSLESRTNQQNSNSIVNQNKPNLCNKENKLGVPFSPRSTGNATMEFSCNQKQDFQHFSPMLPIEQSGLGHDGANTFKRNEHEFYLNSDLPFERNCNQFTNRPEQAFALRNEDVQQKRSALTNIQYENSYEQHKNEMAMFNTVKESNSISSSSNIRRINEKPSMGISMPVDSQKICQVEREKASEFYNISEDNIERKELTPINVRRSRNNYQDVPSTMEDLNSHLRYSPDRIENEVISHENEQTNLSNQSNKLYEQQTKLSIQEENYWNFPKNDTTMNQIRNQEYMVDEIPTTFNRRNERPSSSPQFKFTVEKKFDQEFARNETRTNVQEYREEEILDEIPTTFNRRNERPSSSPQFKFTVEKKFDQEFARNETRTNVQEYREEEIPNTFNRRNTNIKNDSVRNTSAPQQSPSPQLTCVKEAPPKKRNITGVPNERKKIGKTNNLQTKQQPVEMSPPTKGYEYFEIPPPRSKPIKKPEVQKFTSFELNKNATTKDDKFSSSPRQKQNDNYSPGELKSSRISQIPKRITATTKTIENTEKEDKNDDSRKNLDDKYNQNIESSTWDYQKEVNELDNSLQKCLHWNIRNSETVVMSEFNDYSQNITSDTGKSTVVPKKSSIPVAKKEQTKSPNNQGKSPAGKDKNTTMLLTKTDKVAPGQSSYEKRKMYDTRIRKNVKRRSLSENSGPPKMLPLIYEVRYCNVYNQCSPYAFDSTVLGLSRSEQNLSIYSTDFDATELTEIKKSIESLTTDPSCFLKENKYKHEDVILSTEPSCLLKESKYGKNFEAEELCLSTEPSCLLKESRYNIPTRKQYVTKNSKQSTIKDDSDGEEICSNYSSKSDRIKELIKENLLYANYPTSNKKTKPASEFRKRKKRIEKEKTNSGTKMSTKPKSKTKITLRCSKKSSKENGKRLKIVAKLKDNESNGKNEERPASQDDASQRQNLTKLSIDKVNDNEFRVSFEEQKLEDEVEISDKSAVSFYTDNEFSNDRDSLDNSVSSKSTIINCKVCSSVTSEESKETVKERELFITSADDSGYLTKGAEINHSETTIDSTKDGKACCSNILKGFSSKSSEKKSGIPRYKHTPSEKTSKWNQKDLVKLRIQLLFPHVYDDFELLEAAKNTDLIKYYVESENHKLKKAIDTISQKEEMSTRSRSVISLPSVKKIPEELDETNNGDITSEYSFMSQEGGFYNYQKFVAQNNVCYSASILSKLNKPEICGDGSETLKDNISESASVNSCSVSSVKSGVTMKKSVVELFKLRPSSAKKSSSSMFSDSATLVEENEEECVSMNMNLSDEEFFNNFQQIMAIECQKYAKKVRDQSKSNENVEDTLEYEEIPLDCLLKNKNLNSESSDDYLEQEFQFASDEVCSPKEIDSTGSTKKESNESFKSVTCLKEQAVKPKKSNSKWQKLLKKKSSPGSISKLNLDFYPQEKMSILDMIKSVQVSSISDDSLNCSPRDKVLSVISSGEVTKQSEKQFFDNLLAFYDKESELIKKLMRDDEFFSSLIEAIRSSEDGTMLLFQKDNQKKIKKEKKRSILSRFFRWKEKKSTETLFENPSIGKSLEFAKSMSNDSTSITRDSCYSFYKEFEEVDKETNEIKQPNSEYLQQLAYKAKCHLEPMVKATISNRHISDKIKLAGFLKMLDMVAKGDFTFLNTGDNKSLEEKLRDHVAQMFEKVYRIANREVVQKSSILDNEKVQLLKMLVTKYHMGVDTHINILSIYIGRGLICTKAQLEDAIIFLMGQDSQEINLEQFEKSCGISSG